MRKIIIGLWFQQRKTFNLLFFTFLCIFINGCFSEKQPISDNVQIKKIAFSDLNGWKKEDFASTIKPFKKNCEAILKNSKTYIDHSEIALSTEAYKKICTEFNNKNINTDSQMRRFIETNFDVFTISGEQGNSGKFTSYYEAIIHASLKKHGKYKYPVYGKPHDLVEINLRDFDKELPNKRLVGRVANGKFIPYYNRREIEDKGVNAPVIMWGDDLADIHFMQIQGSAIAKMDDGSKLRIGFADSNGLEFKGIGSILLNKKLINAKDVSMPKIREWLKKNPQKAADLMKENERFIFQKISNADGPQGALGVSLTAGRSIAVDRRYIPLGAMMWLDTVDPDNLPLRKIVFAQDIGSAIKGVIRGDYFWGHGEKALQKAGRMNSSGTYFLLAPKNSVSIVKP